MKFFEYLAAGLPVVSTPLPALRDFAALHGVAHGAADFADAIAAALAGRAPALPEIDDPLLQANSWDARLDQMMALIEAVPAQLRQVPIMADMRGRPQFQPEATSAPCRI